MGNSSSSTPALLHHSPPDIIERNPALELRLLHFAQSRLELHLPQSHARRLRSTPVPSLYPSTSFFSPAPLTLRPSFVLLSPPYHLQLCNNSFTAFLIFRLLPCSRCSQKQVRHAAYSISARVFSRRKAAALLALEIRPDAVCTLSQTGHTLPATSIAFSADVSLAATCSFDSLIKLWHVQPNGSAVCMSTLTGHSNPVCHVAFSPCSGLLASSSMNGMIILWTISSGASCICKSKLQHHSKAVFCVSFSPKGGLLAAGSGDQRISLMRYDRNGSAQFVRELLGHSSWVLSLAFHPSGLQLCSGGKDASVRCRRVSHTLHSSNYSCPLLRLWTLNDGHGFGRCIATLTNHTQAVYSVAFSPSGELFATGSKDKSVKLLRLDGEDDAPVCTSTLLHHTATVWSVSFSPNGLQLASTSGEGTIQLWSLCPDASATPSTELAVQSRQFDHANPCIAYNPRGRQLVCNAGTSLSVYTCKHQHSACISE